MSTNLQTQPTMEIYQSDGGVWYQLRSERGEICDALLLGIRDANERGLTRPGDNQLQERLRLIDDALDRLMAGFYGDCVVCGKWIEDNKLHADPALPFCCGCRRRSQSR